MQIVDHPREIRSFHLRTFLCRLLLDLPECVVANLSSDVFVRPKMFITKFRKVTPPALVLKDGAGSIVRRANRRYRPDVHPDDYQISKFVTRQDGKSYGVNAEIREPRSTLMYG